jgi:hypothetical protein
MKQPPGAGMTTRRQRRGIQVVATPLVAYVTGATFMVEAGSLLT